MPARVRVKPEILAERERNIWDLRQKGYTHTRIAAEMGLDTSTITKTLQRLTRRVNAQLEDDMIEQRITQIARLDMIADEALQAWHKSQEADRTVSKRTAQGASMGFKRAPAEEIVVQTKNREGEARYLETARLALADIRKILALDAPVKQDVQLHSPDGSAIPVSLVDYRAAIAETEG